MLFLIQDATNFEPYKWNGPAVDKITFDLKVKTSNAWVSWESAIKISTSAEQSLDTFLRLSLFLPAIAHLTFVFSDCKYLTHSCPVNPVAP